MSSPALRIFPCLVRRVLRWIAKLPHTLQQMEKGIILSPNNKMPFIIIIIISHGASRRIRPFTIHIIRGTLPIPAIPKNYNYTVHWKQWTIKISGNPTNIECGLSVLHFQTEENLYTRICHLTFRVLKIEIPTRTILLLNRAKRTHLTL